MPVLAMNTLPPPNRITQGAAKVSEAFPLHAVVTSERHILAIALALGAREVSGWSASEIEITRALPRVSEEVVGWVQSQIEEGNDPLVQLLCELRPAEVRREK